MSQPAPDGTRRGPKRHTLTEDDCTLLQTIEEHAALLAFAVAGSAKDTDGIEPITKCAQQLHSDILTLMELADVEV